MTGARAGGAAHGHRVDHVHDPCPRQWPHFQPCGDWAKWPEREDGEWPLKMSFLSDRVSDEGFMLPALYLVHGVHEREIKRNYQNATTDPYKTTTLTAASVVDLRSPPPVPGVGVSLDRHATARDLTWP